MIMNYTKFNSDMPKKRRRQNLTQANSWQHLSERDFQELLQLLCITDDLDMLLKIFSTIGICLLTKNIKYERVIKCDALYKKIDLVLKSGLQTKSIIALNLISALLHFDNENELTNVKALHIYVKNMIRISGCLATMTEFFTNFMMQQDTWKALCHSISETCDGSVPNQAFCSHLVPLCVKRYKRGNMDPISILQSLLSNNPENVILFHECNGMSIFDRESLNIPECLQLLNTVVENTEPQYRDEILKASDLFRDLRFYINKYGRNSLVGQWASIILLSHSKAVQTDIFVVQKDDHVFTLKNNETLHNSYNETKYVTDTLNDTDVLFRNVLREAISWQNKYGSKNKSPHNNIFQRNYEDNIRENTNMPHSYAEIHDPNLNKKLKRQDNNIFTFPVATDAEKDLSFSFLLKEAPLEPYFREPNYSFRSNKKFAEVQMFNNFPSFLETCSHKATDMSIRNRDFESDFKPRFVSTPKNRKHLNIKTTSRISRETSTSKTINNSSKFTNTTMINKRSLSRSMSSKFMNILNGSCTTLIKGFKSIFAAKKISDNFDDNDKSNDLLTINMEENKSFACNFTNSNMHYRDAPGLREEKDWTTFSKEFSLENSNCISCCTCNDTVVLKHKFENDAFLQQTVKRLKIGINLYGCDFKKISKTIWPRQAYMTPNVLYNLYRKLIMKQ